MRKLALLCAFLLLAVPCGARTITVDYDGPADFNNIQAGINDANDGDVVIVASGTYTGPGNRDIDFLGKAITVRSTDPNDPNMVAATIIDCDANRYDQHRGFNFHTGEDANSILNGLTIINAHDRHSRPCGGGISCYQSSPTIINCHISSNFGRMGAGIGCQEGNPTIGNCIISDNNERHIRDGGGIFCEDSNATITNCIITNNRAREGGGIFCGGGNAIITNCTITGNTSRLGGGGGVCCFGLNSAITNCTITNNVGERGGGIFCWESNSIIANCFITGNSSGQGGGFCGWDSNTTITNCTISDNSGGYYGGGLCGVNGPIKNCTISGNSAREGGGLMFCSGPISNCIISGNTAGLYGGGLDFCKGEITNCTITDNLAREGGGGVCLCDGGSSINNCIISGNSAWETFGRGGGIFCRFNSYTINNCTITANMSGKLGGGVCSEDSTVSITNCTISDNFAPNGNALTCDSWRQQRPSNIEITNSILANDGNEFWNNDNSTITVNYSDVTGGWPGIGNIDLDPCFVGPGYWADACDPNIIVEPNDPNAIWIEGDYHLLEGSPCIDTGDPNYVAGPNETDLDGNPRIVDGDNDGNSVVDMGAYEWVPGPVELILELADDIMLLNLHKGIENSLIAKLNSVLGVLEDENENNDIAAINTLGAFINAVEAQHGKKIPEAEADALISTAQQIIELLSDA